MQKKPTQNNSRRGENKYLSKINKISLISWALIHNNIVSTIFYMIMLVIDFLIQICIVICIYSSFNAISFDTSKLEAIIDLTGVGSIDFIQDIILFIYPFAIVLTILFLIFKSFRDTFYTEKRLIFIVLSLLLVLLRTFLLTYMFVIFSTNFLILDIDSGSIKVLEIYFITSGMLCHVLLIYFSAQFFNLNIPNTIIPWSETSEQPFILEVIAKLSLTLAYNFRYSIGLKYMFLGTCIVALVYKLFLRLRKSFMFNKVIYFSYLLFDSLLLYLLLFLLPAQLFLDESYYSYLLVSIPLPFLAIMYSHRKFRIDWILENIDKSDSENNKMIMYLQLLDFYVSKKSGNQISYIQSSHYLSCKHYSFKYNKKLQKNYQELENEDDDAGVAPNTTIVMSNASQIGLPKINEMSMSYLDEKSTYNLGNITIEEELKDDGMYNGKYKTSQEINSGVGYKQQLKNMTAKIDNIDNFEQRNMYRGKNSKKKEALRFRNQRTNGGFQRPANQLKQSENNNNDQKKLQLRKEKEDKKNKALIKHLFKKHLLGQDQKDFKIMSLKIYFTTKILKNPNLAHFLLFNFLQDLQEDNFLERNKKILLQKYFEALLTEKSTQNQSFNKLDIQNMLELNQLLATFESELQGVTQDIVKFWNSMIYEKETSKLYENGLKISQSIVQILKIYNDIEEKQPEQKEVKIYQQMMNFYKFVVFKPEEAVVEFNKLRQATQTKKLVNDNKDKNLFVNEKGLIITKLNLRKNMEIDFINNFCCKLVGYDHSEIIGLKINTLMPTFISENHVRFIERFLSTGRYSMINKRKEQFIKDKQGYIQPVFSFLSINHLNIQNMILVIEPDDNFDPFEENEQAAPVGIMLANKDLRVYEINSNIKKISKLSNEVLDSYREKHSFDPLVDDLFQLEGTLDLMQLIQQGYQNFEFSIKYEDLLNSVSKHKGIESQYNHDSTGEEDRFNLIHNQRMSQCTFSVKLLTYTYLNKSLELLVFCFRRIHTFNSLNSIQERSLGQPESKLSNQKTQLPSNFVQVAETSGIQGEIEYSNDDQKQHNFDLSSQTSTTSSASSNYQKFSAYSTQINSKKIPTTLKFVLQIVLIVIFLVITTSMISIILTMSNFKDGQQAIYISNISIQRLNIITQTRLIVRVLFNVASGTGPLTALYLPNRFELFRGELSRQAENLRNYQNLLDSIIINSPNEFNNVELQYMTQNMKLERENRSLSQSIQLYVQNCHELSEKVKEYGMSSLNSSMPFFSLKPQPQSTANSLERAGYYLVYNGNQNLYTVIEEYTEDYKAKKIVSMNTKVNFQAVMTWICIGIIFISILTIIPLFGRIQNRILVLMKIFFEIKKELKIQMIQNVINFRQTLLEHKKNLPKSKIQARQIDNQNDLIQIEEEFEANEKKKKLKPILKTHNKKYKKKSLHIVEENKEEEEYKQEEEPPSNEIGNDEENEEVSTKNKKKEDSAASKNKDLINYFQGQINKSKITQSIALIILGFIISAYFLGTYFLSTIAFDQMSSSINLLYVLQQRRPCAENIIHAIRETYKEQDFYYIHDGRDEIVTFYQQFCDEIELQYQQLILKEKPPQLSGVSDLITSLEDGKFCDAMYTPSGQLYFNKVNITSDLCKSVEGGMATTGITNIFQTIYKIGSQTFLNFKTLKLKYGSNIPLNETISNFRKMVSPYDIVEVIFDKPLQILNEKAYESIISFFGKTEITFIMVFTIFIAFIFILIIIFLTNIFRRLKNEMLLSNRLLYIIDFDNISEEERHTITKFLSTY